MNPIVFRGDEKLTRAESDAIIARVTEQDCRDMGVLQPEVEERCLRPGGKDRQHPYAPPYGAYLGQGVCLLYFLHQRRPGCTTCRGPSIISQLNWIFKNYPRFEGLRAEWPTPRKKSLPRMKKPLDKKSAGV